MVGVFVFGEAPSLLGGFEENENKRDRQVAWDFAFAGWDRWVRRVKRANPSRTICSQGYSSLFPITPQKTILQGFQWSLSIPNSQTIDQP